MRRSSYFNENIWFYALGQSHKKHSSIESSLNIKMYQKGIYLYIFWDTACAAKKIPSQYFLKVHCSISQKINSKIERREEGEKNFQHHILQHEWRWSAITTLLKDFFHYCLLSDGSGTWKPGFLLTQSLTTKSSS